MCPSARIEPSHWLIVACVYDVWVVPQSPIKGNTGTVKRAKARSVSVTNSKLCLCMYVNSR